MPDPTEDERRTWATEDLTDGENVIVRMDWPGDDAVDDERWHAPADWRLREYLCAASVYPTAWRSPVISCRATASSRSPSASA